MLRFIYEIYKTRSLGCSTPLLLAQVEGPKGPSGDLCPLFGCIRLVNCSPCRENKTWEIWLWIYIHGSKDRYFKSNNSGSISILCLIFWYQKFNQTNIFSHHAGQFIFSCNFLNGHFGLLWERYHCHSSQLTPHTSHHRPYSTHQTSHTQDHIPHSKTPHTSQQVLMPVVRW